jgi:hypothetical protein
VLQNIQVPLLTFWADKQVDELRQYLQMDQAERRNTVVLSKDVEDDCPASSCAWYNVMTPDAREVSITSYYLAGVRDQPSIPCHGRLSQQ